MSAFSSCIIKAVGQIGASGRYETRSDSRQNPQAPVKQHEGAHPYHEHAKQQRSLNSDHARHTHQGHGHNTGNHGPDFIEIGPTGFEYSPLLIQGLRVHLLDCDALQLIV